MAHSKHSEMPQREIYLVAHVHHVLVAGLLLELAPTETLPSLLSKMEAALQHAQSATPDIGRALRLKQMGHHCATALLDSITHTVSQTSHLFGQPPVPAPPSLCEELSPEVPQQAIAMCGKRYLWSWETEKYEVADEKEAAEEASRAARAAESIRLAELAEWEEKKASMTKRERKKADAADALRAEESARVQAEKEEEAAQAEVQARLALEADPVARHQARYKEALFSEVREALHAGFLMFLKEADELVREGALE